MQPRTIIPILTIFPVLLSPPASQAESRSDASVGPMHSRPAPAAPPAGGDPPTLGLSAIAAMGGGTGVLDDEEKGKRKWWRWDTCRQAIDLTDEQSDRIEAIFQEKLPKLRRLKTELDRREAHLSALLVEGSGEAEVRAAVDRAEEARSDLRRVDTMMLYRMYKVLTPDQRRKLKTFSAERESPPPADESTRAQAGVRR